MEDNEAKVILVGETAVGKTCIIERLSDPQFNVAIRPAAGCSNTGVAISLDGVSVNLQIWDTAGSEQFRILVPMYFHSAHVVVVV
jgi:small GTP-binding protein